MTKDEKLISREEHPRIGNFLGSDGGNGVAGFLFGIATQKDFCGGFQSTEK
jgi:hypothetical protein